MDISIDTIKKPLSAFIKRFHLIIYIVVVVGLLIFVVFQINSIIQSSSSDTATPPATQKFDQSTIDKVRDLRASDKSSDSLKFNGRYSPFVE